ncbi:MAG: HigA family addiction module antitoxin [Candidatus Binatus sp.]|uniref:HigA family addiction module antitoxin n=1 Tax=Candidatus Binatus sp. TaxID=2811406 RepID=UPI002727F49B|nr:HigA family addiction module antitoxin [Candidatus Binatus sp.]MDO8434122.1 HigA family addiction module antitoxin [Candidatus Binatus sp.]
MAARKKKLSPIFPGEILLEDYLRPAGITVNRMAMDIRVPVSRVYEIVNGRRTITADTALRLARYLGTTPEFWMNLQAKYELRKIMAERADSIAAEVRPLAATR